MRFFKTILVLIALCAPVCAFAQTAEDVEQTVQLMKGKAAKMFNISEDDATVYLRTAAEAIRARAAAEADPAELKVRYAELMKLSAQAQLQGLMVAAEMKRLYEEMKDGVPGTQIPEPLVEKIHRHVAFAGQTLVLMSQAGAEAARFSVDRSLQALACNTKGTAMNWPQCEAILKQSLEMAKSVGELMKSIVPATKVLELGVKRLTY